jgi:voltage-gated potassium channel
MSVAENMKVMRLQVGMLKDILLLVRFQWILGVYLVVYFVMSMLIWYFDPDIHNISDALWFTFASVTTIGYGDLVAGGVMARVLTVILTIYTMAVVAIFTGIIAGFFVELVKMKAKESAWKFMNDLQRLPEMSHEELVEMSERAKEFAKRRGRTIGITGVSSASAPILLYQYCSGHHIGWRSAPASSIHEPRAFTPTFIIEDNIMCRANT